MRCCCGHYEDEHESSFYAACVVESCGCEIFTLDTDLYPDDDDL